MNRRLSLLSRLHLAIVPILAVLVAAYVLFPRATPRPAEKEACASQPACGYLPSLRTGAPSERSGLKSEVPDAAVPVPVLTGGGAPTPRPSGGIGQPASYCKPKFCGTPPPVLRLGNQRTLEGSSTWYDWHPGEAAAGPGLRAFLGPDWRGKTVTVISPGCTCRPVAVRLTDWCLCRDDRVIDLDAGSFAQLSNLRTGIIRVLVIEGDWT